MKRFITIILFVLSGVASVSAQSFPGYNTGNYTGVNGVFFNPANIAGSRYRWDFNLFGFDALVENNAASFKLQGIKNDISSPDSIKNQIFTNNTGAVNGLASFTINGPSLFFNTGRKSAVALTTQSVVLMNMHNIDGKLAQQLINSDENGASFPYTISSSQNMLVNVNAYTAFGLSYARVIKEEGTHYLKGGITLKYLSGIANGYINMDHLNATMGEDNIQQDAYLTNAQGRMAMGIGGINLSNITASSITHPSGTGFGGDIGLVYEYRPDLNQYGLDSTGHLRRDLNKYKIKVSIALLDAGSIQYQQDADRTGAYDVHIQKGQRFYLSALSNASIDHIKDTLNRYPQYFTEDSGMNADAYNVSLPTTLQLNVDYHLHRGFYINLAGQASLVGNNSKIFNSGYYSSVTLTPRYEGRGLGLYVPITYGSLTNITAGLALRIGPLYFGSGSILSALMGNPKEANVFIGVHLGGLQRDREKEIKNATGKIE